MTRWLRHVDRNKVLNKAAAYNTKILLMFIVICVRLVFKAWKSRNGIRMPSFKWMFFISPLNCLEMEHGLLSEEVLFVGRIGSETA